MFKTIFTKTLYEKRWSTLIWLLAFLGYTLLVVLFFPVLKDSFGASLKDVPESLQKILGNASDYQTLTGYVDIQVITQIVFLTLIQGVLIGVGLLAGEENSGTLQTLLGYPVSRAKIFLHKFFAMLVILAATIILGTTIGVLVGEPLVHATVPLGRLLQAVFMAWLVTAFFGSLAFALGAITGKRSIAGGIAGVYAFVAYTVTSIAASASGLKIIDYASPFHYFNNPSIMRHGLDAQNIMILSCGIGIMFLAGLVIFQKRDIYQR